MHAPDKMRRGVIGVLLVTVLLTTAATFFGAQRYFEKLENDTAANRLVLYLRSLNETLLRHQHLPFVLARDPRYSVQITPSSVPDFTNEKLNALAQEARLEAIYLMDQDGLVLASSNANQPQTFVGQNYGFRPYFQDALKGHRSDYFAIGATSGRPGYFVAEPITYANSAQKGVIAIKLDMTEFQRSWEAGSETIIAVNNDNIVVLASNPEWLYRPIKSLNPDTRDIILASRQFGNQTLEPLDWVAGEKNRITIDGTHYLQASGVSDWRGWTVYYMRPDRVILRQTLLATAFFGSFIALLVGFATFLRSRRIALAYTASERRRAALVDTNRRLEHAQNELARSAKLAALGHLAASVTHELGQPISAFRNHLAAAEISNEITSQKTAQNLNKLVDRMEAITGQFRYFARGREDTKSTVQLSTILKEAQELLRTEIMEAGVEFRAAIIPLPISIFAHQIQLEQAFTNLIKNAVHAVENVEAPKIVVDVSTTQDSVTIRIIDNGSGLADATIEDLQEPFFSTKPSGVGMGLGLAITTEIIKDHNGTLSLGNVTKGAEFIVTLPVETKDQSYDN
jgi:two-component system C4-dicarboxylate transport sensor histidine kinase DctB